MSTSNEQPPISFSSELSQRIPETAFSPRKDVFDPNNPPWGIGGAFLVWTSSVILLFLMQLIAIVPYAVLRYKGSGIDAQSLLADKTAVFLSILAIIPAHLLTIGVIWAVVTKFGQRPFWSTFGWTWTKKVGFWTSALLAFGLLGVGWVIVQSFGGQETQLDQIIASSTAARWTIAILASATAPLVEELVYRGIIYSALVRAIGSALAVIGASVLFLIVHVPQYWPNYSVILTIGILSISLTLMRAFTGRLLPSFVMHTVFNGIQSVVIIAEPYVQKYGPSVPPKTPAFILALAHALHTFQ